jgi:hypothetical protein
MEYNDTTGKSGLIQDCEFWTNLGDGTISGDATLLARFTGLINNGYDEVLPGVFSSDAKWQWDDPNQTKHPILTFDLVAGQADYTFITDEQGNSILEIEAVYVKDPGGTWRKMDAVDSGSDPHTSAIFAQNSSNTGTPTRYDKRGPTIWLDAIPNYSQSGGIRLLFNRTPSYFGSTDTTKTPGIPNLFHRLLSMIASRDWLMVNKSEQVALINNVVNAITIKKAELAQFMSRRAKDERPVIRARIEDSR